MAGRNRESRPRRAGRARRLWLFAGVVLVVGAVVSAVGAKATSRSSFCRSCHLMESYYQTWTHDAHAQVECVQCHIPPGAGAMVHAKLDGVGQMVNQFLGRGSTRPAAHVSDLACTRAGCHAPAELSGGGAAADAVGGDRAYAFDHQAHLGLEYLGISVHCTTCHSFVRGDVHFEVNTNACFTCHLLEGESAGVRVGGLAGLKAPGAVAATARSNGPAHASADCRTCHAPPTEPIRYAGMVVDHAEYLEHGTSCETCHRGVTAFPPAVDDSRCLSCHGFGLEHSKPAEELHRIHAEGRGKMQCFNCHGLIEHGPQVRGAMLAELDCRACHAGSHELQLLAYQHHAVALEGLPADQLPVSPMFLAHVACTSCHVEPEGSRTSPGSGAMVARASASACDSCHRSGLGEKTIALWQRTTREMYQSVLDLMPTAAVRAVADAEAAGLLDRADSLLELTRLDGSWGVHNPRYTQSLLEEARDHVLAARARMALNGNHAGPARDGSTPANRRGSEREGGR